MLINGQKTTHPPSSLPPPFPPPSPPPHLLRHKPLKKQILGRTNLTIHTPSILHLFVLASGPEFPARGSEFFAGEFAEGGEGVGTGPTGTGPTGTGSGLMGRVVVGVKGADGVKGAAVLRRGGR